MPIRFFLLALCCLLGAARAAPAPAPMTATTNQAATPWYSVEVLVFRYVQPITSAGETWPASVPVPTLAQAVYPSTAATGAYAALAQNSPLMDQAETRLEAATAYGILAELGWRQSAAAAPIISIAPLPVSLLPAASAPVPASASESALVPASASTSASASAPTSGSAAAVSTPAPPAITSTLPDGSLIKLAGTARLQVANAQTYVTLNLRLCEPAPPGVVVRPPMPATTEGTTAATAVSVETETQDLSAAQSATPCFALNQSQEVTPGQFQYFDNPVFGALVLVQAITPPGVAATAPRAASAPVKSHAPGTP